MKKILLPLIAIGMGMLSANAQKEGDLVLSAAGIKNINIGDNMHVVMIAAKEGKGEVRLPPDVMKKLDVNFSNGRMDIYSRKTGNDTVYLVVDDLKEVTLGSNTTLTSDDVLSSGDIDLYVNDGARAKLLAKGNINAHAIGEFDVEVKRNPVYLTATATIH